MRHRKGQGLTRDMYRCEGCGGWVRADRGGRMGETSGERARDSGEEQGGGGGGVGAVGRYGRLSAPKAVLSL